MVGVLPQVTVKHRRVGS